MAQQLHKAGAQVAGILLLDTIAPTGEIPTGIVLDEVEKILEYEKLFLEESGLSPSLTAQQLTPLTSDERLMLFKQALETAGVLPLNTSLAQIQGMFNVQAASEQAMHYLPANYHPLPIHLFIATEQEQNSAKLQQMTDGWSRYGQVTVHEVSGTHSTMLYQPQVSVLAEKMTDCLQASYSHTKTRL
jgi:thioesterase domain-containing protein